MTQFSLFGAAAAKPMLDDLAGVLLAGGRWVRNADGARLSAVVSDRWRADALVAEFAERDVLGEHAVVRAEEGLSVRTGFTTELAPLARSWSRGAEENLPVGFALTGGGLRLWTIAAGRPDDAGFLLGTRRPDTPLHQAAGAQLSRLGVAAASISVRGRCGWRITGVKRLRRFVELVGPAPDVARRTEPSPWPAPGS